MNYELNRKNHKLRKERLKRARLLGTHTEEEFLEMVIFFNHFCVRCFTQQEYIAKDHIIPLYQPGSSDGIENIQPLCAACNRSKGPENYDWRYIAAERLNKTLPEKYKNIRRNHG